MKSGKKLLAGILAALMLTTSCPLIEFANIDLSESALKASAAESQTASAPMLAVDFSDAYTWSFDEATGTLTISGSGAMPNFVASDTDKTTVNTPWFYIIDDIKAVVVEEGITEVGNYSFAFLTNMTTVKLPESLTKIGDSAFAYCFSLEQVNFPTALNTIGDEAFTYCLGIKKFTYPVVENMGASPFACFYGLEELTIPSGVSNAPDINYITPVKAKKIYNYSTDVVVSRALASFQSYEHADYYALYSEIRTRAYIASMLNGNSSNVDEEEIYKTWLEKINEKYGTSYSDNDYQSLLLLIDMPTSGIVPDYCDLYCLETSKEHNKCISGGFVHYNINDSSICTCNTSGAINENITWSVSLETKTLMLSGSGTLDGDYTLPPYVGYSRFIENVEFDSEAAITKFGRYSFALLANVDTLTIPEGATDFDYYCFRQSGIKTLNLPTTASYFDDDALSLMTSLEEINVTEGSSSFKSKNGILYKIDNSSAETSYIIFKVSEKALGSQWLENTTGIATYAFENYGNAVSVNIPQGVTSIDSSAFYYCRLSSLTIPDSVTSIDSRAFNCCGSLKTATIPDSVTSVGSYIFDDCFDLASVNLGSGVTCDIGSIFSDCPNLAEINISSENEKYVSIDGVIFSKDKKTLILCACGKSGEYVIPDTVTSIGNNAFSGCNALTGIVIPSSVTSIGNYAFMDCSGLTSIVVPDSVTSLGSTAFDYCEGLTSITLGSGISSLNINQFSEFDKLSEINISDKNENWSSVNGVLFNKDKTVLLLYPQGKSGEYVIPNSVTNIESKAFLYCVALTGITIPDSVTSIGNSAFQGCYALTDITVPDSVASIGTGVFHACTSLTNVGIGKSVVSLNKAMFAFCDKLTEINVSDKNETYSSIDGVVFNKDKTTLIICPIGKSGKYVIPEGVTSVDNSAFANCTKLTSVVFPADVTSIGSNVFEDHTTALVLFVYPNSAAEKYATSNNINFKIICTHDTSSHMTVAAAAATCTVDGYTDGVYCNECNKWLEGHETLFAQHTDEDGDGICDVCGKEAELFIKARQTLTVKVDPGEIVYIAFEPRATGTYSFTSITDTDTYGYLYDANKVQIAYNDDGGNGRNFKITRELQKGTKYYFGVKYYNQNKSGDMVVKLTRDDAACDHENTTSYAEVASTCTVNGFTAGVYCDDCGEWISGHLIIASHHTYEINDTFCDICEVARIVKESGSCGEGATWTLYGDGGLIISGTGTMSDYTTGSPAPWYSSRNDIKSVKIKDGITSIGNYAFWNCVNLTSLTIPEGVTSIGMGAFYNCIGLNSISIPDSVTSIGYAALGNCTGLTIIDIGSGVSSLTFGMYIYSYNFTQVNISDKNETYSSIDGVVFSKDKKTLVLYPRGKSGDYVIPDSVTSIEKNAFSYCDKLTGVTVPAGVKSIGDEAFYACDNLIGVTLSEGLETIGNSAFSECVKLANITIPDSVTSLGELAFRRCISLTNANIGSGVSQIDYKTFYGCSKLVGINISDKNESLSSIDGAVFNKDKTKLILCTISKSGAYVVPDTVTSIGDYAFYDCRKLTSITLSNSVTSVGKDAFYDCAMLTDIFIINPNCDLSNASSTIYSFITVHAHINSIVKSYAEENNKNFELIDCSTELVKAKEPTCTEDGNIAHYKCTVCDACYSDEAGATMLDKKDTVIAALNHDYSEEWTIDVEPKCTTAGSKSHHCSRCTSKSDVTDIKALGHDYSDWTTTLEPTCTTDGKKERTCSKCTYVEETTIDALDHDYSEEWTIDVEPKCTTAGSKSHHCSRCTSKSDVTDIKALGHDYGDWTTTLEPTCTTDGEKERTCSKCTYVEETTIDALDHDYSEEWTIDVEPKCTTAGSKSHHCSRCTSKSDVTDIKAPGHDYNNVVTKPTCIDDGYTTHTCSACGDTYSDTAVNALGHDLSIVSVELKPTCENEGQQKLGCSRCEYYELKTVSATGHHDENSDGICDNCGNATASSSCDCMCHKSGFLGFIWKIMCFFYKLFNVKGTCACGKAHY